MVSRRQRFTNLLAQRLQKPMLEKVRPPWLARRMFDLNARMFYRMPSGVRIVPQRLEAEGRSVPGARLVVEGQESRGTLLFLHGGGFVLGSLTSYRALIARIAAAAGLEGLYVDYRRAPEHPFPAALEDALTAYRALLAREAPGRIALCGDSAGGNLVFALLHEIGRRGLPMPGAVAALSPILDLRFSSPSMVENIRRDLLIPVGWGRRGVLAYLAGHDPEDPRASPMNGRFAGLPPVMFQVGESEILRDETLRMAEVLRAQGVRVRVDVWEDVPHVWHLMGGRTPEADRAIAELGEYLRQTLDGTAA